MLMVYKNVWIIAPDPHPKAQTAPPLVSGEGDSDVVPDGMLRQIGPGRVTVAHFLGFLTSY